MGNLLYCPVKEEEKGTKTINRSHITFIHRRVLSNFFILLKKR